METVPKHHGALLQIPAGSEEAARKVKVGQKQARGVFRAISGEGGARADLMRCVGV